MFVEGVAGQAFGDLGFAVVMSLLAALVVALFLIPMLASRKGDPFSDVGGQPVSRNWKRFPLLRAVLDDFRSAWSRSSWVKRVALLPLWLYLALRGVLALVLETLGKLILLVVAGVLFSWRKLLRPALTRVFSVLMKWPLRGAEVFLGAVQRAYPPALRRALASPGLVILIVALSFTLTAGVLVTLDTELLPEVRQGEFTVEVTLPVGTPLEETEATVAPVERAILEEREHIDSLLLTVGYDAANSNRSDEGEHTARFKVLLDRADPRIEDAVVARLRRRFEEIPDLDAQVVRPVLFSFKAPIEVEVHGEDLVELRRQAEVVSSAMGAMPELADVETTLRRGAPEVQVVYDRDLLARYGLNPNVVARLVRDKVQGFEATRFNLEDRRIPIVARLMESDRETVDDVRDLIVNPGGERPIPLEAVARVELGEGPSEVRRVDGRRVALVTANIAEGSMGGAVTAIRGRLDRMTWPSGTTFYIAGQNEEWERSKNSLWLVMALSIFLVYVIMAAQFESLLHPLVILFSIPLAFLGTVLTLKLLGITLSIVVFLGMIMLAGIVVNNAIVLVDYVNTLRRRGLDYLQALEAAGSARLRPILMTTATTTLGLLPMALGLGDGAELRTPMAIAVISGLVVSTLLTLFAIPVLYSLLERTRYRLTGRERSFADSDLADGSPEAPTGGSGQPLLGDTP